jgi:hypothetical protein
MPAITQVISLQYPSAKENTDIESKVEIFSAGIPLGNQSE